MLLNEFFFLSDLQNDNGTVNASIEINGQHKIFSGHFPGQPIVPGVCMLQMVSEVLENVLGLKIQLRTADYLKFLAFINPVESNMIQVELQYSETEDSCLKVNASLKNTQTTFFKCKVVFAITNL